jgi:hypothetical protein
MITPAISVLSAAEGLKAATPALADYVVLLIGHFILQSWGSARIGSLFRAPDSYARLHAQAFLAAGARSLWFTALAGAGLLLSKLSASTHQSASEASSSLLPDRICDGVLIYFGYPAGTRGRPRAVYVGRVETIRRSRWTKRFKNFFKSSTQFALRLGLTSLIRKLDRIGILPGPNPDLHRGYHARADLLGLNGYQCCLLCGCIIAEQATESAVPSIRAADQKEGTSPHLEGC